MKTVFITLFVFLGFTAYTQNKSINEIIEKFEGKQGITSVIITKDLINAMASIQTDSVKIGEILKGINEIKILVIDHKNPEHQLEFGKMVKQLPLNQYKELMVVKEGKNLVKMMAIEKNGLINDFILTVVGEDENVLINISGNLDLKKLSGICKDLKFNGLEHLAKLDKKQK